MLEYVVEPKSRLELRILARLLRYKLYLQNELYFPVDKLLDIMSEVFPKFSYEIVDENVFPKNIHADTDIINEHIRIRESVYLGAINGNGRDRMTIAHEIGHYFMLCLCGFQLQRNFEKNIPTCKSPEWQAKCFAGELLIDYNLAKNLSVNEIVFKCGVSNEAARYQYNIIHNNK